MNDYPAMIAPVGHFEPVPRRIRAYLGSEPVEEDEQVFVHPRSPYVRVDALRSTRTVRVELRGTLLAESDSPVLVFETGLPTRYYLSRTAVRFEHLIPTDTQTQSPYKGTTSGYWSARVDGRVHPDLRVDLRLPDAGVAADRRDAGVLQRAGRHRAGRRPSRTATNPLRTLTGRRLRTVFYRPESDPTG